MDTTSRVPRLTEADASCSTRPHSIKPLDRFKTWCARRLNPAVEGHRAGLRFGAVNETAPGPAKLRGSSGGASASALRWKCSTARPAVVRLIQSSVSLLHCLAPFPFCSSFPLSLFSLLSLFPFFSFPLFSSFLCSFSVARTQLLVSESGLPFSLLLVTGYIATRINTMDRMPFDSFTVLLRYHCCCCHCCCHCCRCCRCCCRRCAPAWSGRAPPPPAAPPPTSQSTSPCCSLRGPPPWPYS